MHALFPTLSIHNTNSHSGLSERLVYKQSHSKNGVRQSGEEGWALSLSCNEIYVQKGWCDWHPGLRSATRLSDNKAGSHCSIQMFTPLRRDWEGVNSSFCKQPSSSTALPKDPRVMSLGLCFRAARRRSKVTETQQGVVGEDNNLLVLAVFTPSQLAKG